jgi:excisionase family DNA binding protein
MTVEEVAAVLRVTARAVYKWIASGEIVAIRIGKRYTRVAPEELQRFLADHTAAPLTVNI